MLFTAPFPETASAAIKIGDVVHYQNDPFNYFGIATSVKPDDRRGRVIRFAGFDNGFLFFENAPPGYVGIASKEEMDDYIGRLNENFAAEIAKGGLSGAISARRKHSLSSIVRLIDEGNISSHMMFDMMFGKGFPQPGTGVYVLMGIYSGQGPSDQLEGLRANPRLSEQTISSFMFDLRPKGFGRIPSDVYNTPATSHGSLVAYRAFEVPTEAIGLVENPLTLEYLLKG